MQKIFIIFLLFLITANCSGTGNVKASAWRIKQSTAKNQLFKEGMTVDFIENNICFHEGDRISNYPVIVTDNRLVIETNYTKWLFEIILLNDSSLLLRELYSKNPLEINLLKIKKI